MKYSIKRFKKFESKLNITEEDIVEIFQDYLDLLDGEKLNIEIDENFVVIKIKNDSWVTDKSGIQVTKTLGIMWSELSNSIEMLCNVHGLNLEGSTYKIYDDGSLKFINIVLSPKSSKVHDSGLNFTFRDINDFVAREGGYEVYVLDSEKKMIFSINKIVAETNRNVIQTYGGVNTLTTSTLDDFESCIRTSRDGEELRHSVSFKLDVRKRTISDIMEMPIFINYGRGIKKPSKITKGTDIEDPSIIEQLEEFTRLDSCVILVVE